MSKLDQIRNSLLSSGGYFPIYMDYQATTPTDPRVVESMMPYFTSKFGNPHSRSHSFGWEAQEAIEIARSNIAKVIGAAEKEIIFTSGATESNNTAIKGVAHFYGDKKKQIITIATEHKCVLDTCRHLQQEGFDIVYLPVMSNGIIDLDVLSNAITDQTALVSVMAVHNEIGVIQPIKEIGRICRQKGVFFHSDIAQGFGKIPINVNECNIDLASISGHKIYGPKGIGALYVRRKPHVRLTPLINGGGQERGIRSGTLPTPLIVGFGRAAEIAISSMENDYNHVKALYERLLNGIMQKVPEVYLNGDKHQRYPGNLNLSFAGIEGESMIMSIKDIAISSGSACTSSSLEPSYVLKSIGIGENLAHTSIRFGIGRFTNELEIDYAVELISEKSKSLRELSSMWEMMQEGVDFTEIKWNIH